MRGGDGSGSRFLQEGGEARRWMGRHLLARAAVKRQVARMSAGGIKAFEEGRAGRGYWFNIIPDFWRVEEK